MSRLPRPGETWRSRDSLATWTITAASDERCHNASPPCMAAEPHNGVIEDYVGGPVCPYYVADCADPEDQPDRMRVEVNRLQGEVTMARSTLKDLAVFAMAAQSDPNRLAEQYRGDLAAVCNRALAAMDAMEARLANANSASSAKATVQP